MKRLTAILGILCIAFASIVGVLPRLVNTQAFLERLDYELESVLGRPVRIEGGLRLELFPHPGFEIRGVTVENPETFGGKPAAHLSRAVVRVDLLPLLEREVRVRHIRMEGLSVNLARDAQGSWNLGRPTLEGAARKEGQGGPDWSFVVQEVSLTGGSVQLDDREGGRSFAVSNLALDLGGEDGKDFSLAGHADLAAGDLGRLKGVRGSLRWTGKGHGGADGDIVVESSSLIIAAGATLPGGHPLTLDIAAVLGLDMGAGNLELRSLDMKVPGLSLQSRARLDRIFGETSAEGDVALRLSDPAAFFGIFGDEPPEAIAAHGGEARLAFAADKEAVTVHGFSLRAGSNEAEGALRVERLDDPMVFIELTARHLDLDEWIVPDLPDEPRRAAPSATAGAAVTRLVEAVQDLDVDFRLRAESLEYEAVLTRNVDIELRAHGGKVESPRFTADLARGRLHGEIGASVSQSQLEAGLTLAVEENSPDTGASPKTAPGAPSRHRNLRGVRLVVHGTPQSWSGSLDVPDCNPRDVLRTFGLDDLKGIDPKALTQAALGVRFSGGDNSLEITQGQLLLDGAKADIVARIPDVAARRVQAQITADRLDLDRYLPLFGDAKPRPRKGGPDLDRPLGLDGLGAAESSWLFKFGQLKAQGVVLRGAEASWSTGQGRARASLGAQVFGGVVSLSGEAVQAEHGPQISVEARAAGLDAVQAQSVLRLQQGLRGKAGAQAQATARGDRLGDLLASLDARLQLSVENGGLVPPGGEATVFGPLAATCTLKPQSGDTGKGFAYQYALMLRHGAGPHLPHGQADLAGRIALPRSLADAQVQSQLTFKGSWTKVPGGDKSLTATANLALDTSKGTAKLADLVVKAMGSELRFSADGQNLKSDPVWRGQFAVSPFVPRLIFDAMRGHKVATRDPGVLALAKSSGEWVWGKGLLAVNNLKLTLDDTDISGHFSLASFSPLNLTFDLEGTSLDVDRYRHPLDAPETDEGPVDMPEELLAALKVKGKLRFGMFDIYGITGRNIRTEVTAEKGEIFVPKLTADTFGGKLEAVASAQVVKTRLAMRYDFTATDFNLGELLVSMADGPYAGGKTTLKATLTMAGGTNDELLETMDGRGRLDAKDGWLLFSKPKAQKGETSIKELIPGKIAGQAKGTIKPEGATGFATAGADILINDGVIGTGELIVDQPWTYKATAKGGTDLVKEEVDYRIDVRVIKLASIPVAIRGPWEDIRVEVNTGAAIVDTATGLVRDAVTLPFRILESLIP